MFRLREEVVDLRALLSNRNDTSNSPRPDSGKFRSLNLGIIARVTRYGSGHWSAGQSEAGSDNDSHLLRGGATTVTVSDLDRELCLERQCRYFKQHIE